jgi:hypothetical protein
LVCTATRKRSSAVSRQNVKRNRRKQRDNIWNGQLQRRKRHVFGELLIAFSHPNVNFVNLELMEDWTVLQYSQF